MELNDEVSIELIMDKDKNLIMVKVESIENNPTAAQTITEILHKKILNIIVNVKDARVMEVSEQN